jgi:hypothetical protein
MLALTKKSRSGILALISTLSGERVDARALPDGVRPLSPTGHQAVRGAGEPPAHVGTAPNGWSRQYCEFVKIDDITPPLNGKEHEDDPAIYLVRAECTSGWGKDPITGQCVVPPWTENFELAVAEGQIIITYLPEYL